MDKFITKILYLIFILFISCSNNELHDFEKVEKEPDFKLFEMLDDYPALKDSLSKINQHEVNLLLASSVNHNIEESKILFSIFPQIVSPLVDTIDNLKIILSRIINQNTLDNTDGNINNSQNFYSFLDDFFKEYFEPSKDLIAIMQKSIAYLIDTQSSKIEDRMATFIEILTDTEGQSLKTILPLLQKGLSKILIIDDKEMVINGKNTDLGNSVKGFDALLMGFNQIFTSDEIARSAFIDFLYAGSDIFSVSVNGNTSAEVLKDLLINIEKYSIEGGNIYDSNSNYNNDSNGIYVNVDLINGTRELWPSFVELFIKAKGNWENNELPDYSKIYDPENGESIMEFLTHQFYQLKLTAGIDLNDELSDYGNGGIEESLLKMIEYNAYGEKRTEANYKVSYLDHLLYTLTSAYDFGYFTRISSDNEPYTNHGYGHAKKTNGIITLNDTLYSMTTGQKIDAMNNIHNAYSLALSHRTDQADYVFRSSELFTRSEASQHKYYMGYDFPALTLLNGFSVGDAGLANGGEHVESLKKDSGIKDISTISDSTNGEDNRTYYPKVGNGFGELNTSRWVMGWMARACWEGEGPYYATQAPINKETTTQIDVNGDGTKETVNIYYLPSGEIYAYVYKENANDNSTWKYFYPTNNSDQEDRNSIKWENLYQRTNRYQAQWHTDYYLFKSKYNDGDSQTKYYSFDSVIGNTGEDKYLMSKYRNKRVVNDAATDRAGTLWYYEKIQENDPKRECATQEEAMFRNYQWLMFEKKIVFTIPMRSYVHQTVLGVNIDVDSAIMNIIEANGIQGVANAKKGAGNGVWNIKGDEGLDLGIPQKETNINYGNSFELGDSRVVVFMKEDGDYVTSLDASGDKVDLATIFNIILGNNHVLPDVVGQNLAPISNMAFIHTENIASDSDIIGNNDNPIWKKRNKLFPIVIALVSNLHKNTYYEADTVAGNHSYNFSGNHKYPIKIIRDLIFMLGQPLIRHFDTYGGRWVPRMNDENSFDTDTAFFAPKGKGIDYRPKENLKSVISILSENEYSKSDGLIPLLSQTKLITKLFNFLQFLGREDGVYADIDKTSSDYLKWGARRKIFYGLEQILTSVKTTPGIAYSRGYFNIEHPNSFFEKTDSDIDLDVILDELIGSKTSNKGVYLFVKNRPNKADWENFNFAIKSMGALFSDKSQYGEKYRILEHLINIATHILTGFKASSKQLIGLRHSLAMITTYYDKENNVWIQTKELQNILTDLLPKILLAYKGNYKSVLIALKSMSKDKGLMQYFLENIKTDEKSEEIIKEIYDFLNSDLISNKESSFWKDISQLMLDLANMLEDNGEYVQDYE